MSSEKLNVIFVLGGPGSGKGTLCAKLVERFDLVHLSAGDLLREEQNTEGSQYGDLIREYIVAGKIIPVAITCGLIDNAMKQSGKKWFLVDGFPRNKDNLDGWEQAMSEKALVHFVLFLDCNLEICTQRILGRGAAGSGREDDNLESLKKRFQVYVNNTMPIIEYYEEKGLVKRIDSSRTPAEIAEDASKFVKEALATTQKD